MSQKDVNIASLLDSDRSGRLRQLHDQLVSASLKTKMPSNSSTLLFEVVAKDKSRHGLVAFRSGSSQILSFPRTYWGSRTQDLNEALGKIDHCHFIETDGAFSSSQYSLRQVRVTEHTMKALQDVIDILIVPHSTRLRA